MSRARLAVLAALTLALLLAGATGLAGPTPRAHAAGIHAASTPPSRSAAAGQTVPRGTSSPSVQVHLQDVEPGIARPGRAIRFTGTVQNTGPSAVRHPVVQLRVADRGLDTRGRLADWASGKDTGPTGDVVGHATVGTVLLPGEELPFTLHLGPKSVHPSLSFGTLPATLEVVPGMPSRPAARKRPSSGGAGVVAQPGAAPLGSLRTFLPWDHSSSYHRLQMSWVIPLTLPSDPALFGKPGRNRLAAWEAAIGPGSRIDGLLTGTANAPVTYVLDPTMVSPYVQATPTPGAPSPSGSSGPSGPSGSSGSTGSNSTSGSSGPSGPSDNPSTGGAVPTPQPTATSNSEAGSTGGSSGGSPSGDQTGTPNDSGTSGSSGNPAGGNPSTSNPSASTAPSSPSSSTETSPTPNGPTSSSSPTTPTTPGPEQQIANLAGDLAARLRNAQGPGPGPGPTTAHPLWTLPSGDPDLGAVAADGQHVTDLPILSALMQQKVPSSLGTHVRTGIAWPVGTQLSRSTVTELRRAYATAPHKLAAAITPRGTVVDENSVTGTAAYKSPDGLPLLTYDERLSALAAGTSDREDGGATVQRFLAETMAIYQQQPAVNRSVLVAPPRGFAGDPEVLQELFSQLRHTPWLQPTTTSTLLSQAQRAAPLTQPLRTTGSASPPQGSRGIPTYPTPGRSPLSPARLGALQSAMRQLNGISGITEGQQPDLVGRPAASDRQLLSTRWRGAPAAWARLSGHVRGETRSLLRAVHVVSSNVNFLADEGALQITVVNNLNADVRGVQLELFADNPNLQIARQPGLLHIGAHSRTSVRVHVSALGAGDVPIHSVLTTPNGTVLGTQPKVIVHVQPTGSWIYWVVGIVAALILALGLFRTYRRGRGQQRDNENGTHET
ncbi:MAG TPA: DUF6049 family protein [Segeticoccus sp.]|uniref:DUF6049 family protein n=1 Tax=Segeticoccus sp. TaxID=2706531 RepID=UPI002D80D999|nr:DUF6049 family protein [Segeticoccus sp.]HET8600520.1 DUF6049 family protein [Segeticoccus sp.]